MLSLAGAGLLKAALCSTSVVLLVVLVALLPILLLLLFPTIQKQFIFKNRLRNPMAKYDKLSARGVKYIGRNFYIDSGLENGTYLVKLGLWHILPKSLSDEQVKNNVSIVDVDFEGLLNSADYPVVVYCHGNAFDRTARHRVELYNTLAAVNFHVIALDYRGYGDSSGVASESGMAEDARTVFAYAASHTQQTVPIFLWGHSLGSGVSVKAAADLCRLQRLMKARRRKRDRLPDGLILESPFNNLHDAIHNHPVTLPFRLLLPSSWLDRLLVSPIRRAGLRLNSDGRIGCVRCPVLILHAKDDHVIPFDLAKKLYETAREKGVNASFVAFSADRKFQHKFICRAEELPEILRNFMDKCETASKYFE